MSIILNFNKLKTLKSNLFSIFVLFQFALIFINESIIFEYLDYVQYNLHFMTEKMSIISHRYNALVVPRLSLLFVVLVFYFINIWWIRLIEKKYDISLSLSKKTLYFCIFILFGVQLFYQNIGGGALLSPF